MQHTSPDLKRPVRACWLPWIALLIASACYPTPCCATGEEVPAGTILKLATENKPSLDEDIPTYLPDSPTQGQRITVGDLAAWYRALVGGRVLSARDLQRAHTSYRLKDGSSAGRGCGWILSKRFGRPTIEHGGSITFVEADTRGPGLVLVHSGMRMKADRIE